MCPPWRDMKIIPMLYKNPARPGATEAGQCHGEKNPVWARVWAREKSCSEMTEKAIVAGLLQFDHLLIPLTPGPDRDYRLGRLI